MYCILFERSVSETSEEKLRKTGIELITYNLEDNQVTSLRLVFDSEDHGGEHIEMTLGWFKK